MLLSQRLSQWVAGMLAAMLMLGVLDYLLRLPGWLRLMLGILIGAVALYWLGSRVRRAAGFRPDIEQVAMRAERMYPSLSGQLASSVAFVVQPQTYAQPNTTAALAHAAVVAVTSQLRSMSMLRLLAPGRTMMFVLTAAVLAGLTGTLAAAQPRLAMTALQRWFAPLGAAQWPRRMDIESRMTAKVWPADTPVTLNAAVTRGYRPYLRTWVVFRTQFPDNTRIAWQRLLMSEQTRPGGQDDTLADEYLFERMIDLPTQRGDAPGDAPASAHKVLEFYFEAGDGWTQRQQMRIVPRPAVTRAVVMVQPPAYAGALVAPQRVELSEQIGAVVRASALVGAHVTLRFELNKAVLFDEAPRAWVKALPGLKAIDDLSFQTMFADDESSTSVDAIEAAFTLKATQQTAVQLKDNHGLESVSTRRYRVDALEDKLPVVSLVEPAVDEAVLPQAVVAMRAIARDDVGLTHLTINVQRSGDEMATELTRVEQRQARIKSSATLDLATLELTPGDELRLTAIGQDVFELDGVRHEPVVSVPRTLWIIDEATLVGQIRDELAGLRQQAIRLADRQEQLIDQAPAQAVTGQQQLTRHLNAQGDLVGSLQQRIGRNQLDARKLAQLLDESGALVRQATRASGGAQEALRQRTESQSAAGENVRHATSSGAEGKSPGERSSSPRLGGHQAQGPPDASPQAGSGEQNQAGEQPSSQAQGGAEQARRQQAQVASELMKLIDLLDQGRDAVGLELQLRDLQRKQEDLAADTRRLMPHTLGKHKNELTDSQREQLEELAARQAGLQAQAESAVQQMLSTAQGLSRQDQEASGQAAAEALAQAAAIAQRQGLSQSMQGSEQATQENKLARAAQFQAQAIETVEQMLGELGQQGQREQEILARQLEKMRDTIKKLLDRQEAQIQTAEAAPQLKAMDQPMQSLRRGTMAAQQQAQQDHGSQAVGQELNRSVDHQASAIESARQDDRLNMQQGQEQSKRALQDGLRRADQLAQEARDKQVEEEKAQLRQGYEHLAEQQDALRDETQELIAIDHPSRKQRAQLIELGHREAELRIAAEELSEKVSATIVFSHMHEQIDAAAQRVTTMLRGGRANEVATREQSSIANMLRGMAAALDDDDTPKSDGDEYAGLHAGGEGGAGAAGAPPELVPPLKELRLMRDLQLAINKQTRWLGDDANAPRNAGDRKRWLRRLGDQQRDLADLWRQLVNRFQTQSPQMIPP